MIEITSVYRTLKSLANEDQSGFITPSSFNDFAKTAQMNVYNEIMNNSTLSEQAKKASLDISNGASVQNRTGTRRAYFLKTQVVSPSEANVVPLPDDFSSFHSLTIAANLVEYKAGAGKRVIMIYDEDKYNLMTNSYSLFGTGTEDIPFSVATMEGDFLRVKFTNSATGSNYYLRYYRIPGAYSYGGNQINSTPSIGYYIDEYGEVEMDAANSRNFDLPASYFSEVVNEMAKLIGIQIEETMVYQYGQQEETAKETPKAN